MLTLNHSAERPQRSPGQGLQSPGEGIVGCGLLLIRVHIRSHLPQFYNAGGGDGSVYHYSQWPERSWTWYLRRDSVGGWRIKRVRDDDTIAYGYNILVERVVDHVAMVCRG
jgi:hypothetical protein